MNFPRMAFAAVLGVLASCSTIDYTKRVEGWPEMIVDVRRVSSVETRDACAKYSPAIQSPIACSEFYFNPPVCRVWIANDMPADMDFAEKHELAHCAGYDHPGSDAMQKMYDQWKARS